VKDQAVSTYNFSVSAVKGCIDAAMGVWDKYDTDKVGLGGLRDPCSSTSQQQEVSFLCAPIILLCCAVRCVVHQFCCASVTCLHIWGLYPCHVVCVRHVYPAPMCLTHTHVPCTHVLRAGWQAVHERGAGAAQL
jgi:hypothetical protein